MIIRSPSVGQRMMTRELFDQMAGRAGRTRSSSGLVVLMVEDSNKAALEQIFRPPQAIHSQLATPRLAHFLLEAIVGRLAVSVSGLWESTKEYTLASRQSPEDLPRTFTDSLLYLVHGGLVSVEGFNCFRPPFSLCNRLADLHASDLACLVRVETQISSEVFGTDPYNMEMREDSAASWQQWLNEASTRLAGAKASRIRWEPLGQAVTEAGMSPMEGIENFAEVKRVLLTGLDGRNELHLLYLVNPGVTLDWGHYCSVFRNVSEESRSVGQTLGISEQFIRSMAQQRFRHVDLAKAHSQLMDCNRSCPSLLRLAQLQRIHSKFYGALVVQDLLKDTPIEILCRRYELQAGTCNGLRGSTKIGAGCLAVFAKRLGLFSLSALFKSLASQMNAGDGVMVDDEDLRLVSGLSTPRLRALVDNGFDSLELLAEASEAEILPLFLNLESFAHCKAVEQRTQLVVLSVLEEARKVYREQVLQIDSDEESDITPHKS